MLQHAQGLVHSLISQQGFWGKEKSKGNRETVIILFLDSLFWVNHVTGKSVRKRWLVSVCVIWLWLGSGCAIAQPQQPRVSDLSEVSAEHWAFQALRRLVEEYQCLQGDTDRAYRGEQLLSRFEYAAALSACLTAVTESGAILSVDSLASVQRLQAEFGAELGMIPPSLEALASQVMQQEAQSFSSTTQLRGGVIFALADVFGDSQVGDLEAPVDSEIAFGYRVRLNFDTSFTGEDRLRIRLQGRGIPALEDVTGTAMANLGFDGDSGGNIEISDVAYQFPISEQLRATISPTGAGLGDYTPTVNPLFSSSSKGSISNIGRENPVVRAGSGAGLGLSYDVSDQLNLSAGYVVREASDPTIGLFGDRYGAIAQITYIPIEQMKIGLTYVNSSNNIDTGTGSNLGNDPFQGRFDQVIADSWGLETAIALSSQVTLGGRLGLINAMARDSADTPSATLWTWSVLLGLTDIGSDDSLLGMVVGQPLKLTHNALGSQFVDPATSLHLEMFYRWQASEFLSLTPGLIVIANPDHDTSNSDLAVVTLRAVFDF